MRDYGCAARSHGDGGGMEIKMRTVRLFDHDAYLREFDATVLSCAETERGFEILLDRTLFFPEEGGQSADTGFLGAGKVTYVYEKEGLIYHHAEKPCEVGKTVHGSIDFAERYRKMQDHTGEHIVSGLIYKHFGLQNVGFHLSGDELTADFDGYLEDEQLRMIETLANEAVWACHPIRGYYPAPRELAAMQYRSKLDLTERVRIVEIEGVDRCACCAPHVANTGEVGMIKLLEHPRYKGGIRIHIKCGADALEGYRAEYEQARRISVAISAKHGEIADGVDRLLADTEGLRGQIAALKQELMLLKLEKIPYTEGNLCLFEADCDMMSLRKLVNEAKLRCTGICAAFAGSDEVGYKYLIASNSVDLKPLIKEINAAICGRGGGSAEMIQGSAAARRNEIEAYFKELEVRS